MHGFVLQRRAGLQQIGVGACDLCVFPALWHGPNAQAQVRGHQARHQQDSEQHDQRGGETDCGHANHGRRVNGSGWEHHGRRVVGVFQGERQVTGGYHLDDPVHPYFLLIADRPLVQSLSDASLVSGPRRTDPGVHVQRRGWWTIFR